jgi:hypothetical protein
LRPILEPLEGRALLAGGLPVGGDPIVNPADFRSTVFVSGLNYPHGMTTLSDGSLLVAVNNPNGGGTNFFDSTGELLRFTDADGDGVADGPGQVLFNGLPGEVTALHPAGEFILATSSQSGSERISVLRAGATPDASLTLVGSINFSFTSFWDHTTFASVVRPTPGQPGDYDVIFNIGSEYNGVVIGSDGNVVLDAHGNPILQPTIDTVGASGLVTGTLRGDSLYMVTLHDQGRTPVFSHLTRIASGLRNAASLAIDPTTGDLYLADNGIDGNDFGNEAWSTDELDRIPAALIGKTVENFGFPYSYVKTSDHPGDPVKVINPHYGIQPLVAFEPLPDPALPATGSESEGASGFALSPPMFPAGLNLGVFIGFHGIFNAGGTANEENPMLFADPSTGHYFDFISNNLTNVGHLDEALSTSDSLFIADISSTGDIFGSTGPGQGVIYQIKAINHPPRLAPIANQSVPEGSQLTVKVSATDPDPGQTLTFSLGSGAPAGATIDQFTGVFTWRPTEESSPIQVTIHVTDNGSPPLSAARTFSIAVTDAPLTTIPVRGFSPPEGVTIDPGPVASFRDTGGPEPVGEYSATIDWGDHTTPATGLIVAAPNGTFIVMGGHRYIEEGTFTIKVTIRGDGGSTVIADNKAVVTDAPLVSTGTPTQFQATQGLSTGSLVVAAFIDQGAPETSSDYSATIDWGDRSNPSDGLVAAEGNGTYLVIGSHDYTGVGTYRVVVTIRDDGGSRVTAANTRVQVQPPSGSRLLFSDSFNTNNNPNGDGWYDVNHQYVSRQQGLLAPLTYLEESQTAAGGSVDNATQVNNPGIRDTLLLADNVSIGQGFTYVSPDQNFLTPAYNQQHIHVEIDPLGPASSPSTDHWAALVFGTDPGSFIIGTGTGVLVRDSGEYELWNNGVLVSTGQVAPKASDTQFYSIDFDVNLATGNFALFIDDSRIFGGSHGTYATDYVTLEDLSDNGSDYQVDYFDDLSIVGVPAPSTAQPNTTYFVSPTGNDHNAGTSPSTAWRTVSQVNRVNFQPGDRILFQGGASFAGNLAFDTGDLGTAAAPITVGSYGSGRATVEAGAGTGISVVDAGDFRIEGLTILGSGFFSNAGDGIRFANDSAVAPLNGFRISNVDVSGFGHVGIHFVGLEDDVSVTYSTTHDNGEGGLAVDAPGNADNYYIGNVQAYHNAGSGIAESGYGIFIAGANDVVVERSVAADNGWLPGNLGETGGIEAIADNRVLLQYDEAVANHQGLSDGDGIILDVTTDSIMQFNYTLDNDGAGLFLFAESGYTATDNVIRYNISQNDARTQGSTYGGLFVGAVVSNADIYNNSVFMGPSPTSSPAAISLLGLGGSSINVRNNIFYTTGGVPVANSDVAYDTGTVLFQGNDYWSAGSPFTIQWGGTTYADLGSWRNATGEETLNGQGVGVQVDPQLNNPGGGGPIGNANLLDTLTAYQLMSTSPVRHAGLDLSRFGVVWDPYGYAGDAFLTRHFDATPEDFYGDPLPAGGSSLFSIGADQVVAPAALIDGAGGMTRVSPRAAAPDQGPGIAKSQDGAWSSASGRRVSVVPPRVLRNTVAPEIAGPRRAVNQPVSAKRIGVPWTPG